MCERNRAHIPTPLADRRAVDAVLGHVQGRQSRPLRGLRPGHALRAAFADHYVGEGRTPGTI